MRLSWLLFLFLFSFICLARANDTLSRVSMGIKRGYFFSVSQPDSYWNPTLGVYMQLQSKRMYHGLDFEFIHATFPKVLRKVRAPGISYTIGYQVPTWSKFQFVFGLMSSFRIGYNSLYETEVKKVAINGFFNQNTLSFGPSIRLHSFHLQFGKNNFVDLGVDVNYLFDMLAFAEYSDSFGESHDGVMVRDDRVLKHAFSFNFRVGWGKEILQNNVSSRKLPN